MQKAEAVDYMSDSIIKDFELHDKLTLSIEKKALYPYASKVMDKVKEFQKNNNDVLVYHIVVTQTFFGVHASVLFVSDDINEWELQRDDLNQNMALAYVINLDYPELSEFGTIGLRHFNGGIIRIF